MINFRTTPVYEKAYAITNNLIKGRLSVAAKQHSQLCAIGKNNPAQTKLITRVAKFDAFTDYALENIDSKTNGYKLVLKYFKNALKTNLFHRKEFKTEAKAFGERYKELYPRTHKMRDKLISQNKVKIENKFELLKKEWEKKP